MLDKTKFRRIFFRRGVAHVWLYVINKINNGTHVEKLNFNVMNEMAAGCMIHMHG